MSEHQTARDVRRLVSEGELLEAVDVARAATKDGAPPLSETDRRAIQIEEIVALSRMASFAEAEDKYELYGLGEALDSPALDSRAKSLKARFEKEFGFSAEDETERRAHLFKSRDLYLEIARDHDPDGADDERAAYAYNAVNALTLSYVLDDLSAVPDVIAALGREQPLPDYWSRATRAEFLLATKSEAEEVEAALRFALEADDAMPGHVATTLRQLRRVAPGHPALAVITPGPVLHYSGHMIGAPGAKTARVLAANEAELKRRIEARLEALGPSAVYGSLASGVDILVVEWALRTGCDARVFLPFGEAAFFRESIEPAGGDWADRARACLAHKACRVAHLTVDEPLPSDDYAYNAVARFAMGGAILRAARDAAEAAQLLVWDETPATGVAGAAADREMWLRTGLALNEIGVADLGRRPDRPAETPPPAANAPGVQRVPKAIIFGDVKNFSKLKESQLPLFVETVMGEVARTFSRVEAKYGADAIDFSNTWGDGVFAVFRDAAPAAWFALRLQERMTERKEEFERLGLPADLAIRLGLHFGVVYPLKEPVTGSSNFFGEAVARAARIEPITTEGRIFASEEFAAELALDPNSPAVGDYVGEVDTAKKYGRFRLYRLRDA